MMTAYGTQQMAKTAYISTDDLKSCRDLFVAICRFLLILHSVVVVVIVVVVDVVVVVFPHFCLSSAKVLSPANNPTTVFQQVSEQVEDFCATIHSDVIVFTTFCVTYHSDIPQ